MKKKAILFFLFFLNCTFILVIFLLLRVYRLPASYTVTLTNHGFSPQSLKIQQGDKIIFRNSTKSDFWPASDPHPTHVLFSSFDSKKPIMPNNSWNFVFSKEGIWSFHDHLHPLYKGTIIVTGRQDYSTDTSASKTSLKDCQKELNKNSCWENILKQTLLTKGVTTTLSLASEETKHNAQFLASCHDTMHMIGQAAFDLYQNEHVFQSSPYAAMCGYGFYHGFMEKLFSTTTDKTKAKQYCEQITKTQSTVLADACYHGVGHGVVEHVIGEDHSNIDSIITRSVQMCKESVGELKSSLCFSGLFMEIATDLSNNTYALSFNTSSPLSICQPLATDVRKTCYNQFYGLLFATSKGDLKQAIKQIQTIPIPSERLVPIQNLLGGGFSLQKNNPQELLDICRELNTDEHRACIDGIAQSYVLKSEAGNEYTNGISFCHSQLLTSQENQTCSQFILRYMNALLTPHTFSTICEKSVNSEKQFCRMLENDHSSYNNPSL